MKIFFLSALVLHVIQGQDDSAIVKDVYRKDLLDSTNLELIDAGMHCKPSHTRYDKGQDADPF